jgi:hypothetical protein
VHTYRGESLFIEQLAQGIGALNLAYKDHNLIELKVVEKVDELAVLLVFVELVIVLLEAVQCQALFVVNRNLKGALHELAANGAHIGLEGG